jgi:hypothetical protein
MADCRTAWALPVSPTYPLNGRDSARCSAFHPTDPAFEPSLYQHQSPPSGNAILQGRDKGPETAFAIQLTDYRDKMHARIAASSGLFALNREISVCAGLRGGVGRTRTSNQAVIGKRWAELLPTSTLTKKTLAAISVGETVGPLSWGSAKYWSEWQDLNLRPPRPEQGSGPAQFASAFASELPSTRQNSDRSGLTAET